MKKMLGHLAYLEIATPDVEASASFYVEKFGMRVTDRIDGKVYLRCWGDYYRYSLILSEGDDGALVNMVWRTDDEEFLEELAGRVETIGGVKGEWSESGHAVGRTYSFVGPFGHRMSLLWDIERYEADPSHASVFPDRPEKRSSHGAAPRFLDHVTIAAQDVRAFTEWYSKVLGFRTMAFTDLDDAPVTVFGVLTTNEKSHDLGVVIDTSSVQGRVHHIAFWVDHPEDLSRTADLLMENNVPIEFGPSIHGVGEQHFLYFRDPSTLRVEVNSGGYRNYVPDWKPNTWTPSLGGNAFFRNWNMPDSMMEAFPAADGMTGTEQGVGPALHDVLVNPWSTTSR